MAHIPQAEIERLKSEVSVQRLAEARGIALRRHGADLLGLCPFHDDHEPSLVVSPKKNLWHCLGACQSGGSVIDWVMKTEGVSFRHAVELLREGLPASAAASRVVRQSTVPKLPAPVTFDADDQALLDQIVEYYHATLKSSPEALAYLEKRGIANAEAIDTFQLGYANRTLGLRLPEKNRKAGAEIRERLQRLGLLRSSGHEHFNGSLVIPVLDEYGHVTEIYGRKILDNLRAGTPLHLYLPGPHRGVWNVAALAASNEIIVCESLIDALTFWCAGYRHVTAAYGIEGFTAEYLAAFQRYGTERVLIAYDRDDAGEKAAETLASRLLAAGLDCYRVQFPKGMDANEYAVQGCTSAASAGAAALKVTPAAKSLGLVLRKAVWMGKGAAPKRDSDAVREPALAEGFETRTTESTSPPLAAAPLPASPVPPAPAAAHIEAEVTETDVVISLGERRYRVRGLAKNASHETLKVNVLVSREDTLYVDTLDLYHARQRAAYVTAAAVELQVSEDVIKHDLGKVLLKCEALQEARLQAALAPKPIAAVTMTDTEREAALALLRDPHLLDRIVVDLEACGLIGETTNKLVAYLATVSRRLEAPLAVVVQSTSAAGKTALMDAVLAMVPAEERVKYSAMTGQSLFYLGETHLQHKVLAIVEEEGASRASYALKLLQSEGELTIASTVKDTETGNLVTQQYRVEGPVMLLLTTTAMEIDEELLNRCLVLTVDEGRAQTQAIHRRQRVKRTLEGLLAKHERNHLLALHQSAQRLLRPLAVVNPYAERLTFLDDRTRARRDHEKYLTLIDAIALLHQQQRPVKTITQRGQVIEYIEVTLEDLAVANRLAHEVLGRSLDELPPQTRILLGALDGWVSAECERLAMKRGDYRFSRRNIRAALGWGDTQLKIHLARLTELEYLLVHRGGRGQSFVYELLYDGQGADGQPFVAGLIDVEALRQGYDAERSGLDAMPSDVRRPVAGGRSGSGPIAGTPADESGMRLAEDPPAPDTKTQIRKGNGQRASYAHVAS